MSLAEQSFPSSSENISRSHRRRHDQFLRNAVADIRYVLSTGAIVVLDKHRKGIVRDKGWIQENSEGIDIPRRTIRWDQENMMWVVGKDVWKNISDNDTARTSNELGLLEQAASAIVARRFHISDENQCLSLAQKILSRQIQERRALDEARMIRRREIKRRKKAEGSEALQPTTIESILPSDVRIYSGTLAHIGADYYTIKRSIPPLPGHSSDYYEEQIDKENVNEYIVASRLPASLQPGDLRKGMPVVVRGKIFEDTIKRDGIDTKITKLHPYDISSLPLQDPLSEKIIYLRRHTRATPEQIADTMYLTLSDIVRRIDAINQHVASFSSPAKPYM